MSITSTGIGSGLDIDSLVSQLMTLERRPITALDQREAEFQGQLSAYGTIKSALSSFQTAVQKLNSAPKFRALTASSSDATIYTAIANTAAVPGTHSVEVKQLAQSQKLISTAFTNTTDTVGTGTLTIQYGSWDGGAFNVNGDKPAQVVTIGAGNGTLAGIRDAINNAKISVTASILNDGTGNRLVLTSTDTGAANSLRVTISGDSNGTNVDASGLSQLAYDPAGALGNGKNLSETQGAQNAILKVDGVDNIAKSSNTITDVLQGVTLSLLKQSAANTAATLTVSRDTAAVQTAIEDFVKAYNVANGQLKDLTGYDAKTKRSGMLQGDVSVGSMLNQIRRALGGEIAGLRGVFSSAAQIGVAFQRDGTLAVDAAKLQTALTTNFDDIAGLFIATGKPTDALIEYVSAGDSTQPGSYSVNVTTVPTRGALNGVATAALADTSGTFTSPFTIDGNNDELSVLIDGIASGVITLTQGSYATGAALTAEIQSKINGDAALRAANVSVSVAFDSVNDRLALSSNLYGAGSTVEMTSVDVGAAATLGFSVASGSAGVNAAGVINGLPAMGDGRVLTASSGSGADSLRIQINGGATGDRGVVEYSRGIAHQLDSLLTQFLAGDGPISSRTDGIQRSIDDIGKRREFVNQRLGQVERRYRDQFNALDVLLSQMRTTSDFLVRQLATLPGANRS